MKTQIFIVFILLSLMNIPLYSQNPFLSKEKQSDNIIETVENNSFNEPVKYPAFVTFVLRKTEIIQKKLNNELSNLILDVKDNKNYVIVYVLFIAFIYGIIHALGPGHGKAIVSSFFLTNDSNWKKGIAIGGMIAFIHTLSAVIITLSLYYIVKKSILLKFENVDLLMKKISFSLIIAMGIFLFIKSVLDLKNNDKDKIDFQDGEKRYTSLILPALIIGIIPCPGAMLILLFALNNGLLTIGIGSVIIMSAGMSITISLFALGAIFFRKYYSNIADKKKNRFFPVFLNFSGSIIVLLFGIILLLGVL